MVATHPKGALCNESADPCDPSCVCQAGGVSSDAFAD